MYVLPKELAPSEDNNFLMAYLDAPPIANLRFTEKYTRQFSRLCKTFGEIQHVLIVNGESGVNTAMGFIALTDKRHRSSRALEVLRDLNRKAQAITGVETYVIPPPTLPISRGVLPVQCVLKTVEDYATLSTVAHEFAQKIEKAVSVQRLKSNADQEKPQFNLELNVPLAARSGLLQRIWPIFSAFSTAHASENFLCKERTMTSSRNSPSGFVPTSNNFAV